MDPLQLLIVLTIAGICGAFAQLLVAFDMRGMVTVLVSVVVGIVGIFVGRALSGALIETIVVRVGNQRVDLVWTIICAALVLVVLRIIRSGGRSLLGQRA